MTPSDSLIIFIGLTAGGVILEALLSKIYYHFSKKSYKKHHFALSKFIYLMIFPFIAAGLMILNMGMQLIQVFVTFAIIGTITEYLIGYSYNAIVGERLWTYQRFGINKHTSLLAIPLWGLGGILFWLLVQVFG